jgi:hypothetical protein
MSADSLKVLDDNGKLTDDYKQCVKAALPAGIEVRVTFWRKLEGAITGYQNLTQRRAKKPPLAERKRWRRIKKQSKKLRDELHAACGTKVPPWANEVFATMKQLEDKADAHVQYYDVLCVAFKGRSNPDHWFLFGKLCDLWLKHVGPKLKRQNIGKRFPQVKGRTPKRWQHQLPRKREIPISRSLDGTPIGPLVRFLDGCARPILSSATPTAHTWADIASRKGRPPIPPRVLSRFLTHRK